MSHRLHCYMRCAFTCASSPSRGKLPEIYRQSVYWIYRLWAVFADFTWTVRQIIKDYTSNTYNQRIYTVNKFVACKALELLLLMSNRLFCHALIPCSGIQALCRVIAAAIIMLMLQRKNLRWSISKRLNPDVTVICSATKSANKNYLRQRYVM